MPIVAIGASAGGIEAFKEFFSHLPPKTGLAFVIAQHLSPDHKSGMVDLLRRMTSMEVIEAGDGMRIFPNRVHMIPPGNLLRVEDGHLRLKPAPYGEHWSPVDHLFFSLAKAHGSRAIAIELSGMGSDGTKGMEAIRKVGGLVVVQAPESARSSSMPSSVIASGVVDIVAPAHQIPELLLKRIGRGGEAPPDGRTGEDKALDLLERTLREETGHDFANYKRGTIMRRVKRRMDLRELSSFEEYAQSLKDDPEEVKSLFGDLLVGVTEFFREPQAWEALIEVAIKPMLRDKRPGDSVRVWVAGCATGQEAYSVGMVLLKHAAKLHKELDIKVFGSDINEHALSIARMGVYPKEIAKQLDKGDLQRFFNELPGDGYQVKRELRDCIVFAQQSLIADAPFSRLDLVTCRNVLIYLEPQLQRKILKLFHFALAPKGYLFLGNAESIAGFENQFHSLSKKWRIFQALASATNVASDLPIVPGGRRQAGEPLARMPGGQTLTRLAALAQQLVLQRFAPAAVMINRNFEILYYCGPTQEFLVNPTGLPTHNLLDMARTGLRTKLRTGVQHALKDSRTVVLSGIKIRRGNEYAPISIRVSPMHETADAGDLLLVVFEEESKKKPDRGEDIDTSAGQEESLVRQLEYDLKVTREDLQANVEELETSNEELKAANEEMTSMNEELQSANEELETSKEEMQSLNEELATVNNQLQVKVDELEITNDDLENLLTNAEFATIFLDRELRVRRFTPPMKRLISLTDNDVGRPLSDFSLKVRDDAMLNDAQRVLDELETVEAEVTAAGRHYIRRVLPYRVKSGDVEGVVITFTDITHRKATEDHQRMLISELDHRVKNTLTVVQSLASQTLKQSRSLDDFRDAFEGRLMAMGRAHALLSQAHWKATSLGTLVEKIVVPYCGEKRHRCRIGGNDVLIEPNRAVSMTMVLHELATNATKYGALSSEDGHIDLKWQARVNHDHQTDLELSWVETDGPPVPEQANEGFGIGLIKRILQYELQGRAKVEFSAVGLRCTIHASWPTPSPDGQEN